jgi:Glycosyl transferase family 11
VIIVEVTGGLGNQMFQYALGKSVSTKLNVPLQLDVSGFERYELHNGFELERIFCIKTDYATNESVRKIMGWQSMPEVRRFLSRKSMAQFRSKRLIVEPYNEYCEKINTVTQNVYLSGYWQSEKYFKSIEKLIRNDFSFKIPMDAENLRISSEILSTNSVALHFRRGDYVSNPQTATVHGVCEPEYYRAAIRYIEERVVNPYFFIFSDDIEWVRSNFKIAHPHQYIENNKVDRSFNDLRLMALCQHNIIANSSFSWWGAWLNANNVKIVVAPDRWYTHSRPAEGHIPEAWIRL